jgi:hypothetical protein
MNYGIDFRRHSTSDRMAVVGRIATSISLGSIFESSGFTMFRSRMPASLEAPECEPDHATLWDAASFPVEHIFWRLDEDIAVHSCICSFGFGFE